MAFTRSASLALLLAAAAVVAANAATVGPWTPFTARVKAAEAVRVASDAAGDKASTSAAAAAAGGAKPEAYDGYYEEASYYYEHLIQAALQQTAWRQCGQSETVNGGNLDLPTYFAQLDFTCAAPQHYADDYRQTSSFFATSMSTAMTCSAMLSLNTEAYATVATPTWLTTSSQPVNIGRIEATCRASNVAEECGAPCNKGLVIALEGDIFVAFVRSKVATIAKPANGDGSCGFLGTNGVVRADASVSVAAASQPANSYYSHEASTLTNGVAIIASGTTSIVGLKDKELRTTGLWEYAMAVASTTGNNVCQLPFLGALWCATGTGGNTVPAGITIANPANAPIVRGGSLELQFFPA